MHITQIVIQGFKSYKDQTAMDPLARGLNVVVGRNGSGKSNFFWAIRFVLGDAYGSMTREERQSLLHEGTGPATISAFVEITFDNTDNRFPTGRDEVILRRTIGLKKDEYSLDKKSVTKSEVMSLLESAGFSRSNPYYIVPQGRITSLTNAKDYERLQLLKEVAGTKVYEQRRQESIKIMEETQLKQTKIDELLTYIDDRLGELEEERDQLDRFQERDRERRCIEYAIHSREQREAVEGLTELEIHHSEEMENSLAEFNAFNDKEQLAQGIEEDIQRHEHSLRRLVAERQHVEEDYQENVRARAQLELVIRDAQDSVQAKAHRKEELQTEVARLESEVDAKTAELDAVAPEFAETSAAEATAKASLEKDDLELKGLQSKAGRAAQFRNARDRDRWLRETIESLSESAREEKTQAERLKQDMERARERETTLSTEISDARTGLATIKTDLDAVDVDFQRLRHQREELEQQRKKLWKEEATLSSGLDGVREDLQRCERTLFGSMDRAAAQGLQSVRRIVNRLGIKGVHGPLYELFRVTEGCRVAVDVIASASLFHIVVDTDTIATRILDELNRERGGRVTFMPLNRLKVQESTYPDTDQAKPMLQVLEYDKQFHKAFVQVFGKAMICQSLESGSGIARSHGLTAVTLDGDRADRKGALSGGYRDHRQSRLDAAQRMMTAQERLTTIERDLARIKTDIERHNQLVTRTRDDLSKLETRRHEIVARRVPLTTTIQAKTHEQTQMHDMVAQRERSLVSLQSSIASLDAQMKAHEAEIGTPLRSKLTETEQARMRTLMREVDHARTKLAGAIDRRVAVESRKNALEIELNSSLKRRCAEAKARLDALEDGMNGRGDRDDVDGDDAMMGGASTTDLESRRMELAAAAERAETASSRLQAIDRDIDSLRKDIAKNQRDLEKARVEQADSARSMERHQRRTEKYMSRRAILVKKKDDAARRIADLGVLPTEAFERYANERPSVLLRRLHDLNNELKLYGHVNKKAFEQYISFAQQKEQLQSRKDELDRSHAAIEDLIGVLDQRKDEAIERTFDDVARNFEEVWAKVVPMGRGQLIMLRRSGEDRGDGSGDAMTGESASILPSTQDEDAMQATQDTENATHGNIRGKSTIEQYIGVAISVSFTSRSDEGLRVSQLSGGQKSLVALALIFAIQRSDPAPFYLFDEIDAALDAQYRTAIADMIRDLAHHAQFVITTFRPELLAHADKFYGVTFSDKVSRIQSITREQATQFVDSAAQ